ncbi:MAG: TIGR00725 family protein [bacterium]|nr:TIGR00725 family protein [bacterium]
MSGTMPEHRSRRRPVIGVMGGSVSTAAVDALAEALGEAIAREGWVLLCGGRPAGVMEAASRGAARQGGLVVGVLPGEDPAAASPHVGVAIATGFGWARNAVNVLSSTVVVALPGRSGTLSEIALALGYGRPVLLLGWEEQPLAGFTLPLFQSVGAVLAELRLLTG